MDIRIKATDYEMTPEVADYLDHKIASLGKHLGGSQDVARIEVELGRDAGGQRHGNNMWFAEIRVVIPGDEPVYARNNSESVNGAIDDVKEEAERQLRKRKHASMSYIRKSGAMLKRLMRFGGEV